MRKPLYIDDGIQETIATLAHDCDVAAAELLQAGDPRRAGTLLACARLFGTFHNELTVAAPAAPAASTPASDAPAARRPGRPRKEKPAAPPAQQTGPAAPPAAGQGALVLENGGAS